MEHVHEEERNGLTINIIQDEMAEGPDAWGDTGLFLVNYHRDFYKDDEEATEDVIRALYTGEKSGALNDLKKRYHFFPLACLVHSGVWLKLGAGGFACDSGGWDTSHVGAVLVSKKEWRTRDKAAKAAEGLVKEWNDYLSGNVYGYDIEKDGETLESCWGFYGDYDAVGGALEEARAVVDNLTHKGTTDEKGQYLMSFVA